MMVKKEEIKRFECYVCKKYCKGWKGRERKEEEKKQEMCCLCQSKAMFKNKIITIIDTTCDYCRKLFAIRKVDKGIKYFVKIHQYDIGNNQKFLSSIISELRNLSATLHRELDFLIITEYKISLDLPPKEKNNKISNF